MTRMTIILALAAPFVAGPALAQSCDGVLLLDRVTARIMSKTGPDAGAVEHLAEIRSLAARPVSFRLERLPVTNLGAPPDPTRTHIVAPGATASIRVGVSQGGRPGADRIRAAIRLTCL